MSGIPAILPIQGVPDELLRALNDRFRLLDGSAAAPGSDVAAPGLVFEHKARPSAAVTPLGTYGTELDRGALYQMQTSGAAKAWVYVSGVMCAAVASQPSDLGKNDAGFRFLATDTYQEYRWSGTAWVEVTPANDAQIAYATGAPPLTLAAGVYNDIPGVTLTLNRAGRYLITGNFDFGGGGVLDANWAALGRAVFDGVAQPRVAAFQMLILAGGGLTGSPVAQRSMVSQQFLYTATAAGKIVKLQAEKTGGTGTSAVLNETSISALWIGP